MARVFIDGFESGRLDLWDTINAASIVSAQPGMDGDYCVYINGGNAAFIRRNIPSASEYYIAFRIRITSDQTGGLLTFNNGSTQLGSLRRMSGYMVARRGSPGGTTLATGSTTIVDHTTYLIEVRYKPHGTNGQFVVKVNGVIEIDYTGNTTPGATTVDNIIVGVNTSGHACYAYFDNIVIDDSEFPGNTRIQAIKPTGAGNSTQWTPSAGSNWDCVDEIPASDSDYVSTSQANDLDIYNFSDLSGQIESIKCVQAAARVRRQGDPMPTKLQLVVRTGGSNYFGSAIEVPTSVKTISWLWNNNPATSQPWTVGEINNAEFGFMSAA